MDGRRHREREGKVEATRVHPMPRRSRDGLVQALRARDDVPISLGPVRIEVEVDTSEPGVGVHFIEIELLDMNDQPVPGERYRIELPDGTVRQGSLDGNGRARIDRLKQAGTCKVTFPHLDQDAWEGIAG